MKQLNIFISGIIIVGTLTACSESEFSVSEIEAEIENILEEENIASTVTCIVDSMNILWTGNFGYANIENGIPADIQTIYPLQSITKIIVSFSVFQLWEQELISLNEDVSNYLPFPVRNPNYPNSIITVEMLLNHCSGLAWPKLGDDYYAEFHYFYYEEEPPPIGEWIPEFLLPEGRYYSETVWKNFPPGERYLYSNIGASLLALMVEERTEMDFRDYCREFIFDPLGMDHTTFYLGELDYDHIATPYFEPGSPMYFFSQRHYPAGFANSNLVDFAKFAMTCLRKGAYEGGRLLNRRTFDKMIELKNSISGTANLWDHYLGGSLGHIGGGTGWSTSFEMNLNTGMAFFIFANDSENNIFYPGGEINELVKYKYSTLIE